MKLPEALIHAERTLDAAIADHVTSYVAELLQRVAASGEEDQDALDRPPDPDADWRRATPEEMGEIYRARLGPWRTATLADLCAKIEQLYSETAMNARTKE